MLAETSTPIFCWLLAGAAIGFAVEKTEGLTLSWWLLPVGIATLCWGISFYFGCKNLTWVQKLIYYNFNLLELQKGVHPKQPPRPQLTTAVISEVEETLKINANKASLYATWQFRALIVGAIFFIGWRIAEMIRLTHATLHSTR